MKKKSKKEYTRFGKVQMKILILLGTGIALGLTHNPTQYFRILRQGKDAWDSVKQAKLKRSMKQLRQKGYISVRVKKDGTAKLILTPKGKNIFQAYTVKTLSIKKPKHWDGQWRIVLFDIPEDRRKLRDIFRKRIKQLGCYELQKSVFVHPYECFKEMEILIDFYHADRYVCLISASYIRNDALLRRKFHLQKKDSNNDI